MFSLPITTNISIGSLCDILPIVGVSEDAGLLGVRPLITKSGRACYLFEIQGIDFAGQDSHDKISQLELMQAQIWADMSSHLSAIVYHAKVKRGTGEIVEPLKSGASPKELLEVWDAQQKSRAYEFRHFVLLSERSEYQVISKFEIVNDATRRDILEKFTVSFYSRMGAFEPKICNDSEFCGFLSMLFNGHDLMNSLVTGVYSAVASELNFDLRKGHFTLSGVSSVKTGALLSLNGFSSAASEIDGAFLEAIFQLPCELLVYTPFYGLSENEAKAEFRRTAKNTATKSNTMEDMGLVQQLTSGTFSAFKTAFVIQILVDSEAQLLQICQSIERIASQSGILIAREYKSGPPVWWARLPEAAFPLKQFVSTPRQGVATNFNLPHLTRFARANKGHRSCAFGNFPVLNFSTLEGNNYDFIFNSEGGFNERDPSPPHTFVIGGTGSGKTTFISLLEAAALTRFPDVQGLTFDSKKGTKRITQALGGIYHESKNLRFNPFDLDIEKNAAYIRRFFEQFFPNDLSTEKKNMYGLAIDGVIRFLANAPLDKKNLTGIRDFLGSGDEDSLFSLLRPLYLENGIFTGAGLSFGRLTAIDMETLFPSEQIFLRVTDFLIQKISEMTAAKKGFLLFVDEMPQYLTNEDFAQKVIITALQQLRKENGVFIGASQAIRPLLRNKHFIESDAFRVNTSNFFFFRDGEGDLADYSLAGITEKELAAIKTLPDRHVFLKRKFSGESVILNVDLSIAGGSLRELFGAGD